MYKDERDIPCKHLDWKTPHQRLKETQDKADHIRNKRKFELVEEWECEFKAKRRRDENLNKYFKERQEHYKLIKNHGGVDIHEAFFGGRTNNIKFDCDVSDQDDADIKYYDFRSLYPTVLKYKCFPIGHPKVNNENFADLSDYFGFVKCVVSPPEQRYIPILPYKNKKNKLVFPLCRTCLDIYNRKRCRHSEKERHLIGTWTTEELKYAVQWGYNIEQFIEVYHYETKSDAQCKEYINL